MPATTTLPPKRESLVSRLLHLRRGPWEWLATIIIAAGVIMLMQPVSLLLYGWSFATILTGTIMFVIVSHFPE
ncbi:MAG TPA: hypothetical protein VFB16_05780 [Bauldia sp.]|nr:hypothetical protein [Bauldia sp.]